MRDLFIIKTEIDGIKHNLTSLGWALSDEVESDYSQLSNEAISEALFSTARYLDRISEDIDKLSVNRPEEG